LILYHVASASRGRLWRKRPSIWSPRRPMPTSRDWRSGSRRRGLLAQSLEAAAGFLDRRRSALGRGLDLERRLHCPFPHAKNLDPVAPARDDSGFHEALDRNRLRRAELARLDRLLNAPQVDLVVIESRGRREAALRQAAMQRHLAT